MNRLGHCLPTLLATALGLAIAGHHLPACTCYLMETEEGPVFGANLDLFIPADGLVFINPRGVAKEGFQETPSGAKAEWVSHYGSVTFNLAGREFAWGGINEAGLVIGSMELLASAFPAPDERAPLTIGSWAQYMLDTCATVEEVIAAQERVRIEDAAPPIHFLIADASGRCAGLEWFEGQLACHTGDALPIQAMSNMPYDTALADFERGGHPWWQWKTNPGRSAERFAAAHLRSEYLETHGEADPIRYAFDTLTQYVAAGHTKWNVVYRLSTREVWFRTSRAPEVKYLRLDALDFTCGEAPRMLDIHATAAGDVRAAFQPFDFDANKRLFQTLCARYELGVSEEVAQELMDGFARFECAP